MSGSGVASRSSRAPDPLGRPSASRATALLVAAVCGLVLAVVVVSAATGVRGTDQYWYLADVETLVHAGTLTTNVVFPVGLLGPERELPPPVIHNTLSLYLAAVPGVVLGPLAGWLTMNTAATLGAAALIYLAAARVAARGPALICAALYPLLPVTLWHTAQPLAEPATAFFAALVVALLAYAATSSARWLLVLLAAALLYYSRSSYLPLLALVPLGLIAVRSLADGGAWRNAIVPAGGLVVAALLAVAVGEVAFDRENVEFSYTRLLHAAVPGQTDNMAFNFDLSAENVADRMPFRPELLATKLVDHLVQQLVRFDSLAVGLFYWTFNALAAIALVVAWRVRRPGRTIAERLVVLAGLAMVALHVVTIALFQNQVRYTLPALPPLLVVAAMGLSEAGATRRFLGRHAAVAFLAAIVLAVPGAAFVARTIYLDAAASGGVEREVEALIDAHLGPDDRGLVVYQGPAQLLAYAARPRLVLHVVPDYGEAELERLLAAFGGTWLLAPEGSAVTARLPGRAPTAVGEVDVFGTRWSLLRLETSSGGGWRVGAAEAVEGIAASVALSIRTDGAPAQVTRIHARPAAASGEMLMTRLAMIGARSGETLIRASRGVSAASRRIVPRRPARTSRFLPGWQASRAGAPSRRGPLCAAPSSSVAATDAPRSSSTAVPMTYVLVSTTPIHGHGSASQMGSVSGFVLAITR